jgi:hypothetical protein
LTNKEAPKLIKEVNAHLTSIAGCCKRARSAQATNARSPAPVRILVVHW